MMKLLKSILCIGAGLLNLIFPSFSYAWECWGTTGELDKGKGIPSDVKVLYIIIVGGEEGTSPNWLDKHFWEDQRTGGAGAYCDDYKHSDGSYCTWPEMPCWLTDSLIAPIGSDESVIMSEQYHWSISNFFYRESHGKLYFRGDVNPGTEQWNASGEKEFFVAQYPLTTAYYPGYETLRQEIKDNLPEGKSWNEYIKYDGVHTYDYIVWFFPRGPNSLTWPNGTNMGGYNYGSGCDCGLTWNTNFNSRIPITLVAHEYGHTLGLGDKYEAGIGTADNPASYKNPYTLSEVCGIYSVMRNVDIQPPLKHCRPYSSYDKIWMGQIFAASDQSQWWMKLMPIVGNGTYTLYDFATSWQNYPSVPDIYKIPVSWGENAGEEKEYFLIVNFQPVLNDNVTDKYNWDNEYSGKGLLIWHIREDFTYSNYSVSGNFDNEKYKREDVECAIGLYDTSGACPLRTSIPPTPCPEFGWDNIDQCVAHSWFVIPGDGLLADEVFNNYHNGSPQSATDFFPVTIGTEYKNSFTHLTNPSSNGYNYRYPDLTDYQNFRFTYGGDSYTWPSPSYTWTWAPATEASRCPPENIATHIAIKNIREDPINSGIMKFDVLLDYMQSDVEYATGANNGRRIIWDSKNSKLHMVYNSLGHIYYTYRFNNPSRGGIECWTPAVPLDIPDYYESPYLPTNSEYPAMTIDEDGGINVCWIGPTEPGGVSAKSLFYRRQNPTTHIWGSIQTLITQNCYPPHFSPPAMVIEKVTGDDDTVHIAIDISNWDSGLVQWVRYIKYCSFPVTSGTPSPVWEIVDVLSGTSPQDISPSIDVSDDFGFPHICWVKDVAGISRVYFAYKDDISWKNLVVTNTDDAVINTAPAIDLHGGGIHIVYTALNGSDREITHKSAYYKVAIDNAGKSIELISPWQTDNISNSPSCISEHPIVVEGSQVLWREWSLLDDIWAYRIYFSNFDGSTWSTPEPIGRDVGALEQEFYPQACVEMTGVTSGNLHFAYTKSHVTLEGATYEVKYETKTTAVPYVAWTFTGGGYHNNQDWNITSNTTIGGMHTGINNFTIASGCTARIISYDTSGYLDTTGIVMIKANTINISGVLSAAGKGYPSASGPYKGSQGSNGAGAGGGSGMGQAGSGETGIAGGNAYPDTLSPLAYIGCGGGNGSSYSAPGGYGGGIIHLSANLINLSGVIESNGTDGEPGGSDYAGAGGGAGAIWISCDSLSGNGTLKVAGGNGAYRSSAQAGGGSGGYLEIDYKNSSFNGHLIANGGTGAGSIYPDRAQDGQSGIIKVKQSDGNVEMLVSPVNTTTGSHNKESSIAGALFNTSSVILDPGDSITGNTSITTSNEIYVAEGAVINADKKGFSGGNGTGKGTNGDNGYGSGGAGYGNVGGNGESGRQGGCAYGEEDSLCPTALGSGAGKGSNYYNVAPGGAGGGSLKLTANNVTINGLVSASGEAGSTYASGYASGAGSGGSVYIICDSLKGSGVIQAKGNNGGNNTDADGGGSAGGRIALIRNIETFSGNVSASGGIGPDLATDGGEGKVCRAERGEGGGTQGRSSRQLVYKLYQNYPNPFSKRTTLMYEIPATSEVSLKLYDLSGRCVRTLVGKENKLPGVYKTDLSSEDYPAGIYFAKFVAGKYKETKKLVLMK